MTGLRCLPAGLKTLLIALSRVIRVITRFADKRLTAYFAFRTYNDVGHNMTYATSSPAATSGGQGQVPVSWPFPSSATPP